MPVNVTPALSNYILKDVNEYITVNVNVKDVNK